MVPPDRRHKLEIVFTFNIKMSAVLEPSNLNFMKMFALQIICLTETWLNDLCYDHNLLPDCYAVFPSGRASTSINKTRGSGVLIVLSSRVGSSNEVSFQILR
jgi:hypothetical protein